MVLLQELVESGVWTVTNGLFPSNCYIHACTDPHECLLVDPGLDPAPIEAALETIGRRPIGVLCTHGHFDHAGSAAHFQQRDGCPVHLHERDLKTLRSSNFLLMAFKIPARVSQPEVTAVSDVHPVVSLGGLTARFHPVPGHTPGSCLIEIGNSLFSGDTLYSRGVGLSRLPGEDADQLKRSILAAWARFGDAILVRPGHGEAATLGDIKRHNMPLLRFIGLEASV
jgi:glyoxylase-like metal-dependent hydrolase (beta-lactamase superfamily II)